MVDYTAPLCIPRPLCTCLSHRPTGNKRTLLPRIRLRNQMIGIGLQAEIRRMRMPFRDHTRRSWAALRLHTLFFLIGCSSAQALVWDIVAQVYKAFPCKAKGLKDHRHEH